MNKFRSLIIVICVCLGGAAHAACTKATITANINSQLPSNGVGGITALVLRNNLISDFNCVSTLDDPNSFSQLQTFNNGVAESGNILLAPAFSITNPGNAGIYSHIANPSVGYTTIYNGVQFSLGSPILAAGQFGQNAVGIQQAFVATLNIPSTDTAGNAGFADAGYCLTSSTSTGCVGVFGFGGSAAPNTSQWSSNHLIANCSFQGCTSGFNDTVSYGDEYDFEIMAPATNSPTRGIYSIGNSSITQTNANNSTVFTFLDIDSPGITQTPHLKWINAIQTENGSATNGISLGAQGTANNSGSQGILFNSVNSIGGGAQANIQTDPGGDLLLTPVANGAVALQDGNGTTNLETSTTFGSSDVSLPKLVAAGALCNSASGVISSTTGRCNGNDPSDVVSVSNSDSSLTISPTTGAVVASLNVAHANTWSVSQTFSSGLTGTVTGHATLDAALTGATFSGAVSGITTLGTTGVATLTNATASTSTATGTAVLSGGLGVAGAGWFGTYLNTGGVAIGSLPACGVGIEGARMYVTNGATSPTFLGTVSATGAVIAPVFCNGTAWVYG